MGQSIYPRAPNQELERLDNVSHYRKSRREPISVSNGMEGSSHMQTSMRLNSVRRGEPRMTWVA